MDNREVEERLTREDYAAHNLKAKAFELRVDRLNMSIKNAETKEDHDKYIRLKDESIKTVRKYKSTF